MELVTSLSLFDIYILGFVSHQKGENQKFFPQSFHELRSVHNKPKIPAALAGVVQASIEIALKVLSADKYESQLCSR